MATATTSALQQQVDWPAIDARRAFGSMIAAEGVALPSHLLVSQRGAGANMSVDVSAGSAWVQDDHGGGGGFYPATWSAVENVLVATADPTNPRIDRIVLRVHDQALGDPDNTIAVVDVAGTPTSGATLANLNGAAAVPGSSLLLANVLVPAATTSIVTADIASVRRAVRFAGTPGSLYNAGGDPLVTYASSTTETDMFGTQGSGITVPGGTLGTSGLLRVSLLGDTLQNGTGNTITVKAYYGGSSVTVVVVSPSSSTNRNGFRYVFYVAALGATNKQAVWAEGHAAGGSNAFDGSAASAGATGLQGSELAADSTVDQTLRVTFTNSASSANAAERSFHVNVEALASL